METRLVDDLDGGAAVETVCFSLDGRSFEIDLSERHLAELRTALEPFVRVARRVPGGGAPRRPAQRGRAAPAAPAASAAPVVPAERSAPAPEVAVPSEVAVTPPQRRPAPLVADPFNPDVRLV